MLRKLAKEGHTVDDGMEGIRIEAKLLAAEGKILICQKGKPLPGPPYTIKGPIRIKLPDPDKK